MSLSKLSANLSHHAYLLIGSESVLVDLIPILAKKYSIKVQGNPDFFDRKYETFTIDDAREIKSLHSTKPVDVSGKKIFVLQMNGITVEAQNALLKLLEEPAEYAHFFIIIPSAHLLLPTVKSRMSQISLGIKDGEFAGVAGSNSGNGGKSGNGSKSSNGDKSRGNNRVGTIDPELLQSVKKLVTLSKAKRLEEVKKLIDDIAKEKKTKLDAIDLLNAIQNVIYEDKGVKEGKLALEAVEVARNYIHDRAPSVKMLLEYVALNL